MKKNKIIYWIATIILGVMMLFSAYSYVTNPQVASGFQFLGFPDYFRIELAVAKLAGAIVLLIPAIPRRIKEWAYVGFSLNFLSAFIAHIAKGDATGSLSPLLFLAVLIVSWVFVDKQTQEAKSIAYAG